MSDCLLLEEQAHKITLCVLRTQDGKTFTAINRIRTEINQDDELGRSIHIVFTMNTLLNNSQFAKRLYEIEETYGKGSVVILSSKYNGPYSHVTNRNELLGLCIDRDSCPRVVLMCTNNKRSDDGIEFLKTIDKNTTHIKRAFAYYDELHKYIDYFKYLRSQIEEIHSLSIIRDILALSATPDNIWTKTGFWSKLRHIDLDNLNDANYAGCNDMIFNCIDDFFSIPYVRPSPFDFDELDTQTLGFINHVLMRYPEILGKNTRTFIPAHVRRSGHDEVQNIVFDLNKDAVIVKLNGFEKIMQYNDSIGNRKTITLVSSDEEVCETIVNKMKKHNLILRPLVITGFLCVGMGQTLTHKTLGSFTSAIFGHLDLTNDDIYQLFGRVTGRMKEWGDKYVQTQVYCPTITMHRIHVMEECAKKMAREYNGKVITKDDYRKPMYELGEIGKDVVENLRDKKEKKEKIPKKVDTDKIHKLFDTQEEAIEYGRKSLGVKLHIRKGKEAYNAPKTLQKDNKNPTVDYLLERMWGIDDDNLVRMVITNENKWCVYWRPSILKKSTKRKFIRIKIRRTVSETSSND